LAKKWRIHRPLRGYFTLNLLPAFGEHGARQVKDEGQKIGCMVAWRLPPAGCHFYVATVPNL
jgi:hypothetical protein